MAEDKKSIIVYADWIEKFEALEDDEAGRLIKHFFRYVNDLNPEFPDKLTKICFLDIQNTLKRDLAKWEQRAERSRENGKKGGRPIKEENPRKPTETKQVISEPRKPDSVSGNVSVSDTVNEINKIMEFFNFTETANYDKMRDCSTFINLIVHQKLFDTFKRQFEAYRKLKGKDSKFKHAFNKFLGTAKELYLDGAWNSENWEAKLPEVKKEIIINGFTAPAGTSSFSQ